MMTLRIIFEELRINVLETLSYKFGIISDLFVYGGLQIFLFFSNTGSSLSNSYVYNNSKELLLLGYITWILSCACISNIGGEIKREMMIGTFYQKINAFIPIHLLYIGKLLASLTMQMITIIGVYAISVILFNVKLHLNIYIILLIFLCMIGMYGVGLIIGGFAVYYKQINSIVFIIQMLLLFVSDVLTKKQNLGYVFKIIPLTYCNDLIRKVLSSSYVGLYDVIVYILICSFNFFVGIVFLNFMIKQAKKRGNLLQF
ncbi:ABC transporter permease [Paramaledivibacter caminithermalis]|jgi:ABC-2 type transport system permease protein|uniref:ABC-2 type transport system permease protein n=1 Tax=Paramaledivibacter caminithermalis (strain DSM 15212 / CIP 107654 / DViRD3) TaxID=1121301 RepID=A0A1M6RXJ6_PARC5|nr:ABC transporter permease [Paramaledivibacter caminithermalis]SHK37206.1 ABC-2 type transport system permease protein [Paramaledivibacter caminithermalis DSM 15212]